MDERERDIVEGDVGQLSHRRNDEEWKSSDGESSRKLWIFHLAFEQFYED